MLPQAVHKTINLNLGPGEYRRIARTLAACALSYGAARLAGLPDLYWAVITTLIVVTQPSLNQALNTGRDQIVGAVIGALTGGIGLVAILYGAPRLLVFAIALVPLAAIAALRPTMRLACTTLVVVVLIPGSGTGASPFERPIDRVLEIFIGAAAAIMVALLLPNRAINAAHERASEIVLTLGELIGSCLKQSGDATDRERLQRQSASAEKALDEAITEAGREHIIVPLKRTSADVIDTVAPLLTRLHRDALFLGQAFAANSPLNGRLSASTRQALDAVSDAFVEVSKALAATLGTHRGRRDENIRHARASFKTLQVATGRACGSMEHDTVLPFVLDLLVQDFADIVATLDTGGRS